MPTLITTAQPYADTCQATEASDSKNTLPQIKPLTMRAGISHPGLPGRCTTGRIPPAPGIAQAEETPQPDIAPAQPNRLRNQAISSMLFSADSADKTRTRGIVRRHQAAIATSPEPLAVPARHPHESEDAAACARKFCRAIVLIILEALTGRRNPDHIARWVSPELFAAIARRAGMIHRILGTSTLACPSIKRTSVQILPSGACEACLILQCGPRVRGASARLEHDGTRWIMTHLAII